VETREKNLERILSSPTSLEDLITSISLSSTIYSFIVSSIICVVLMVAFGINFLYLPWYLLGILLLSLASSYLGVLISAIPTDMTSNIMVLATLIKFPLIFLSGIFVPLNMLPLPLFIMSLISPTTYFVDLLKSTLGIGSLGIAYDLIGLLIWLLIVATLAYVLHKKTILKRL
ncbi:MAG: ABC transporter permease, partial [Candidatus Helarchaeota archaeon]